MNIGVLVTSIGNFGKKGFYNSQEVGLAKALEKYFPSVEVYKLVTSEEEKTTEKISGCKHATIHFVPAPNFGINGMLDCSVLNRDLDALIYFADTQLCVPRVYRWCKKNHVQLFPYIGVVESHSTNFIKKTLINALTSRNLRVFQKCHCFCKTPEVEKRLNSLGIAETTVTPVGLDTDLLKKDYRDCETAALRKKYGYGAEEKVILFIGRFIEEKRPLEAIEILQQLVKKDKNYRLLMVGNGVLEKDVRAAIEKAELTEAVKIIKSIPNTEIWELYRFAEVFLNLNQQEIFGMAILEAMYYGCRVVACDAPGPSYIIENKISGFLGKNKTELIEAVEEGYVNPETAHQRILDKFTWNTTAQKMTEILR